LTDILSKIKLGEAIESYETVRQRKDGQYIYVFLTVSAVYDAEGRILGASTIARDITERKRMETLLKESEEQYRLLFENANDGIVLIEKNEGKIANINPSVEKMLGYSARESIGNKLQDVGLIIDNGDFQITMKNLNERGLLRYNDIPVKAKSGKQIYTDTYLVDKAKFAQCNIRDITERKQAEVALRESEERFRIAAKNASDLIWEWDIVNGKLEWFGDIDAILGYAQGEFPRTIDAWERVIHLDDHDRVMAAVDQHLKTQSPYSEEYSIRRKDGTLRYWTDKGVAVCNSQTHPYKMIGVCTDITERKRAEKDLKESESKYRLLAENVNDVIFVLDMNLNYTYISPSVKILRGYEQEEAFKRTPADTLTPSSMDLFLSTLSEIMEMEKTGHRDTNLSPTLQLEMKRKDGTTVWTEVKASFIRDENQRLTGIMGVTRDITERRQAEAELQQTLKSLRKAVGATIQVMVSAVEMRDPYTAGHQSRVADLAIAIATEMVLPRIKSTESAWQVPSMTSENYPYPRRYCPSPQS
jgi:PAS domain S-box-containing protein